MWANYSPAVETPTERATGSPSRRPTGPPRRVAFGVASDGPEAPNILDPKDPAHPAGFGPIARAWGYSADLLALAATLSPVANGGSRIFWGWVSDRLGRESTMVLSFTLQAMCLFLVVTTGQQSSTWFVVSLVAVYFTWGQIYSLFPATSGDYFGSRHATSNYAVLYTAKGVAAILGGWIGALLAEQSGSWTLGFYGSTVMALIAATMAVKLRSSAAAFKAGLRAAVPVG